MSRYRYHGPVMGLTLVASDGSAGGRTVVAEEILVPGRSYTLPADHPRVVAMVAARRLTLAAEPPAEAPPADPPSTDPITPPEALAEAAPRRRRTKEL